MTVTENVYNCRFIELYVDSSINTCISGIKMTLFACGDWANRVFGKTCLVVQ